MNDIAKEITELLSEYSDKVARAIEHADNRAADTTIRELKARAPRDKGKTGYSTGFAKKKVGSGRDTSIVIYNKNAPGLTHLLEYGHVKANQHGSYPGRVMPRQHWYQAEQAGIQEFENDIRSELGG